jgi:hypothetical protein
MMASLEVRSFCVSTFSSYPFFDEASSGADCAKRLTKLHTCIADLMACAIFQVRLIHIYPEPFRRQSRAARLLTLNNMWDHTESAGMGADGMIYWARASEYTGVNSKVELPTNRQVLLLIKTEWHIPEGRDTLTMKNESMVRHKRPTEGACLYLGSTFPESNGAGEE